MIAAIGGAEARKNGTYQKWTVAKDISIQARAKTFGLEIISRVLRSDDENWPAEIEKVSKVASRGYSFETDHTARCSTHVHIGKDGGFSIHELRRIAKGVKAF